MSPHLRLSTATNAVVSQTEVSTVDFHYGISLKHAQASPLYTAQPRNFHAMNKASAASSPAQQGHHTTNGRGQSRASTPDVIAQPPDYSEKNLLGGLTALAAELSENLSIAPPSTSLNGAGARVATTSASEGANNSRTGNSVFGSTRPRKLSTFSHPERTPRIPLSRTLSDDSSSSNAFGGDSIGRSLRMPGTTLLDTSNNNKLEIKDPRIPASPPSGPGGRTGMGRIGLSPTPEMHKTPQTLNASFSRLSNSVSPDNYDTPTNPRNAGPRPFRHLGGGRILPGSSLVANSVKTQIASSSQCPAVTLTAPEAQSATHAANSEIDRDDPLAQSPDGIAGASANIGGADIELTPKDKEDTPLRLRDPWYPSGERDRTQPSIHPLKLQFQRQAVSMPQLAIDPEAENRMPGAEGTNASKVVPPISGLSAQANARQPALSKAEASKSTRESFAGICALKRFPPPTKVRRTQSLYPTPEQFVNQYLPSEALDDQHSAGLQSAQHEQPHNTNCSCSPESDGLAGAERGGLQTFEISQDPFRRIYREQLVDLLDGRFGRHFDTIKVIDCRFEYEYTGGHIDGAININSKEKLQHHLIDNVASVKACPRASVLLVFHCEYSAYRGPLIASHLRSCDRRANLSRYPYLHYPDIVILEGGYSKFFEHHNNRCVPQSYVGMNDRLYRQACARELERFRSHMSLRKVQSLSFCQGQGSPSRDRNKRLIQRGERNSSFI